MPFYLPIRSLLIEYITFFSLINFSLFVILDFIIYFYNKIYIAISFFLVMANIMFMLSIILSIAVFIFISFLFFVVLLAMLKKERYKEFEPKISVIIPAYNEETRIKNCLDSILTSSYKKDKIEIIVVDDGSTDNTLEVLKNYGIKVLKQEHLGKSKALNKGILVAKNEFVLVIDADTKIDKDFIKEMVRPFSDKKV